MRLNHDKIVSITNLKQAYHDGGEEEVEEMVLYPARHHEADGAVGVARIPSAAAAGAAGNEDVAGTAAAAGGTGTALSAAASSAASAAAPSAYSTQARESCFVGTPPLPAGDGL